MAVIRGRERKSGGEIFTASMADIVFLLIVFFVLTYNTEVDRTQVDLPETWVRTEIGPIAKPDVIQWAPGLPKTRSGKIMRRILRKVAANEIDTLGDTSTLADPGVVDDLIHNRANK